MIEHILNSSLNLLSYCTIGKLSTAPLIKTHFKINDLTATLLFYIFALLIFSFSLIVKLKSAFNLNRTRS